MQQVRWFVVDVLEYGRTAPGERMATIASVMFPFIPPPPPISRQI